MVRSAQLLLLLSACAGSVSALTYRSVSMWRTPSEFLSGWYADPSYDKSGGFIEYVDTPTARANGMLKAGRNGGLWFGVETKAVSDAPRKSLRFRTKAFYGDGLMVVDVAHAPSGCGTWPAIWSVQEENWPFGGEIDIMEQVSPRPTLLGREAEAASCVAHAAPAHRSTERADPTRQRCTPARTASCPPCAPRRATRPPTTATSRTAMAAT